MRERPVILKKYEEPPQLVSYFRMTVVEDRKARCQ